MNTRPNRLWSLIIIGITCVIIVILSIGLTRYRPAGVVEINLPSEKQFQGLIQIRGDVANPGIYPFNSSDNVDSILRAAGFTFNTEGDLSFLLTVLSPGASPQAQKININLAEEWLLEALPGIGATKATAIVVYRTQNGLFRHITELVNVEGIGQSLYDEIKDFITVTD
jgi:competence protein ComEA